MKQKYLNDVIYEINNKEDQIEDLKYFIEKLHEEAEKILSKGTKFKFKEYKKEQEYYIYNTKYNKYTDSYEISYTEKDNKNIMCQNYLQLDKIIIIE